MEHGCFQIGLNAESRRLEGLQSLLYYMGDHLDLRDVQSPPDLPASYVCSTLVLPCSSCQNLMPERVFPLREPLQQLPLAQHPHSSALYMVPAQHQPAEVLDAGSPELSCLVLTHCLKWSPHRCSPACATCCCRTATAAELTGAWLQI